MPFRRHSRIVPILLLTLSTLLAGCAGTIRTAPDRPDETTLRDTADTRLGRMLAPRIGTHPGQSGFMLLENGLDAFVARAVLIEQAQRGLDLQYYLYHNDRIGALVTALLLEAADRGVRVRLLVDDMDMGGRDEAILALDSHPNIEIRLFNPFSRGLWRAIQFVTGFGTLTRRMHNKALVADNQAAILGGRNIGDEYFSADPGLAFADLDVLTVGPVVDEVSDAFDRYWNSPLAWPAREVIGEKEPDAHDRDLWLGRLRQRITSEHTRRYLEALKRSALAEALREGRERYYWGSAHVVVDDPEKVRNERDAEQLQLRAQIAPLFRELRQELLIVSPYFVPGRQGVEFLRRLTRRGIRVRILTNSLASNDVSLVHAGYMKYRRDLLRAGVELHEMKRRPDAALRRQLRLSGSGSSGASLHAKTFLLDRRTAFIGSLNLDPRSFYENTEIGLVLESPEVGAHMARALEQALNRNAFRLRLERDTSGNERLIWIEWRDGERIVHEVEPDTTAGQRLLIRLLSLLPVESQL